MISVVIPLYNKEVAIGRCIDSVLKQSLQDWELVVVDDGSTDNSPSIVKKYLSDVRIKYLPKQNGGVSSARNYGVRYAKGEWIVFLDADDYLSEEGLQILYDTAVNNHTLVSTANYWTEKENERRRFSYETKDILIKSNFRDMYLGRFLLRTGATMFHRSVAEHHLFNEKLSRYEDMESILNIMRSNKIAYSGKYVMVYSLDNTGLSHKASDIRKDFISCMDFEGKTFWEKIQLASLLNQGFRLYPECREMLREKYASCLYYAKLEKLIAFYIRVHSKIFRLFEKISG